MMYINPLVMKQLVTFLLFSVSFIGLSQEQYNSVVTPKHIHVDGSKISLSVPDGYEVAVDFPGFSNPDLGSSIMVNVMPFEYKEIKGVFKQQEQLDTQNMQLLEHSDIIFNGINAELVQVTQDASGLQFGKYVLIFGKEGSTILINGILPIEYIENHGQVLKEAILSTVYHEDLSIDPFSALPYSIDVSGTKLQFATTMSSAAVFSVDGKVPTESQDKTTLIVANSLSEVVIGDKLAFAEKAIKTYPGYSSEMDIVSTSEVLINGVEGVELVSKGVNNDGEMEQIAQIILFQNNKYYRIIGTSLEDYDDNLQLFRDVANTFQIK